MSKTHQQIWIISFKSIFLKSYIDISCILLPVESPHLGFFWSFAGRGGVKVGWTCRITLSVLWHLLTTVYKQFTPTSVIHYLLNVDSISFKRDPEVTHKCTETITRRTMSRAGRCHTEVNMEVTECNVCGFVYTNSWADDYEDEDEKKERDVLIIVFCRTMAATTLSVDIWIFVHKREFHMKFFPLSARVIYVRNYITASEVWIRPATFVARHPPPFSFPVRISTVIFK